MKKIKKYLSVTWAKDFPDFFIFKRVDAKSDEEHVHDFIELVYVCSGEATEVVNGEAYEMTRGDLLIMDYGCRHVVEARKHFSYFNILIYAKALEESRIVFQKSFLELTGKCLEALSPQKRHMKLSFFGKEKVKVEQLLESIISEQSSELLFGDIMKESYMVLLLIEIIRKQKECIEKREKGFAEILLYIDSNLMQQFSLEDFALRFFYNPSYFSRLFKKKTGETFRSYILKKRMEKAAWLLKYSELSVEDIINEVGYESRSSFFRTFNKLYGMTPTQYRKREKK